MCGIIFGIKEIGIVSTRGTRSNVIEIIMIQNSRLEKLMSRIIKFVFRTFVIPGRKIYKAR